MKPKLYLLIPIVLFSSLALSGCAKSKKSTKVLRILNCEDYIYEYEEGDEENASGAYDYQMDVMDQFVQFWADTHDGEVIEYVYDTFDTNETMFNELQTGKTTYDVIVPSDYMIQKLISNDMLHPFSEKNKINAENEDNVWSMISPYLKEKFVEIKDSMYGKEIADYAVPYMWGTMGMMYNPHYYEVKVGLNEDTVHDLFRDWDSLYGPELKGSFSIKDAPRDTYSISLIHAYRDIISETTDNGVINSIFNDQNYEKMEFVKSDMLKLKDNAFGFECDSGKTDMTTEKIGANMCWSGDATWAITEARDDEHPEKNIDLYYSVPTFYEGEEGKGASNIWFDGLCMPENKESDEAQYDLAESFIKFMSTPEIAVQNCYCVGYTPGVAGDAMFEYMLDSYDVSEDEEFEGEMYEYDLTYFYEGTLSDYEDGDRIIIYADPDMAKRELAAQYPEEKILDRLAIMKDFGPEYTQNLLDIWEQVRTNPLPTWGIIVIISEVCAALALGTYFVTKKVIRNKLKKAR